MTLSPSVSRYHAPPYGPWDRSDVPILTASPDAWDRTIVTNPAPCFCSDGSILLCYRSNTTEGLRIGVARAEHFDAPFVRCTDAPLFSELEGLHVEDPFARQSGNGFKLIAKDMTGTGCGERWGGVHLVSEDGICFRYAGDRFAYSRTLLFAGGTRRTAFHPERLNISFRNGEPLFLSAAYGVEDAELPPCGNPAFDTMTASKTLIIPFYGIDTSLPKVRGLVCHSRLPFKWLFSQRRLSGAAFNLRTSTEAKQNFEKIPTIVSQIRNLPTLFRPSNPGRYHAHQTAFRYMPPRIL